MQIRTELQRTSPRRNIDQKFIIQDDIVYFISSPDDDPILRLYVPFSYQEQVLMQYHDLLGHSGIQKTYDTIKEKYYFPKLYKRVAAHIENCQTCEIQFFSNDVRQTSPSSLGQHIGSERAIPRRRFSPHNAANSTQNFS